VVVAVTGINVGFSTSQWYLASADTNLGRTAGCNYWSVANNCVQKEKERKQEKILITITLANPNYTQALPQ
jgi:hypothetical protein